MAEVVEWVEVARRGKNFEVLLISGIMDGLRAIRDGAAEVEFEYLPKNYRQFDHARWFSEHDVRDYVGALKKLEEEKPGAILRIMQDYEKDLVDARKFGDELARVDFASETSAELLDCYNKVRKLNWRLAPRIYHYIFINKFYPDSLTADIASMVPDVREQNKVLKTLFTADKPSEVRKEKESVLRIAEEVRDGGWTAEAEDLIERHLEKYAFLGMYFFRGTPYSKQDIAERVKHFVGKDLGKEKRELEEQAKSGEKTREIVACFRLSEDVQLKIQTVKQTAFAANDFDESYTYLIYKIKPLFNEIAERIGVEYEELIEMLPSEIIALLEKNARASAGFRKQLLERPEKHALVYEDGKIILLTGKDFEEYYAVEKASEEDYTHLNELRGQPASPGKATGKVHKIMSLDDVPTLEKGDVLVAAATTPAFVPAMEKAAAIVTNEGGLLCHAAIVSRELGVPCVVGTKIATKVFRDGDVVEVDANRGIVKKL